MATPTGPRNWEQIVKDSNGQMQFVPAELVDKVKHWAEGREEFFKKANELAKIEAHLTVEFNALILELRQTFDAKGAYADIWTVNLGFELNAMKEGKYIISFTKDQRLQ
jgi:hypothetical protein